VTSLKLQNPKFILAPLNRNNISYFVRRKVFVLVSSPIFYYFFPVLNVKDDLGPIITDPTNQPFVIYVQSITKLTHIFMVLNKAFPALQLSPFHAELSSLLKYEFIVMYFILLLSY
jgi:hypothetical protein